MNKIIRSLCASCGKETDHAITKVYSEDQLPHDGTDTLICTVCGHSDQEPKVIPDDPYPDLGKCCECGSEREVFNILFLDYKLPAEYCGKGWGCLVCNLPCDGAVSVLCNKCFDRFETDPAPLTKYCGGYPNENIRIEISPDMESFGHDMSKHKNEDLTKFNPN